jgi:hypothetical protein
MAGISVRRWKNGQQTQPTQIRVPSIFFINEWRARRNSFGQFRVFYLLTSALGMPVLDRRSK